ncbi:MAG: hypothetical protein GC165_08660 [Armatimonadetes bacterium]|nr:hypothetical protein [Armatimonadota bacterium]
MKLLSSIVISSLALAGIANAQQEVPTAKQERNSLGVLGKLVRTNPEGNYKFDGATTFSHNGTRGYVTHFARLLSSKPGDVALYEDVMMQGIKSWEDLNRSKGFVGDIAGAFAHFTVINLGIAKHTDYKDYLEPNLVSQYRKSLASRELGTMSNAKKQSIYDYLLAESVYAQTLASIGRDMDAAKAAKLLGDATTGHLTATFGTNPSNLSISETGLRISM